MPGEAATLVGESVIPPSSTPAYAAPPSDDDFIGFSEPGADAVSEEVRVEGNEDGFGDFDAFEEAEAAEEAVVEVAH